MKPASSGRKGSDGEREFARVLGSGVRRMVLSGGAGGNDLMVPSDSLWSGWAFEIKRRAKLPAIATQALAQAEAAIPIGSPLRPAAGYREDRGRWIVAFFAEDLVRWVQALAEVGQASKVKAHLRIIERELEAVRRLV